MTGRRDFSILCCLYLATLLLILNTPQGQATSAVNCRKYVFAPVCRGVAAKRSFSHTPSHLLAPSESLLRIPAMREYFLERSKLAF